MQSSRLSSRLLVAASLALCLTSSVTAAWSSSTSERMSRALKQVEKKDYEGAVASYTEILSENPNSADAYLKRADARIQLKDFDGAMSDYDQAVKVNSNFVESYVKRADLKVRLGDPQSAITDYTEALRLNPKDAVAHTNRAIAYKLNGDFAKAADDCTWALNADPTALDALEERADCKMKANNLDGAIADYKALFKKNKSKASHLNYNMGRALMLKGNKAEAREYFDDAIEYHSRALKNSHKNAEDYMKRGLTYIEMQEPDKAIDDFENAIAIAPDDAVSHYQLGHLRLTMGDNKKAVEQLSAALKIDPKQNPALLDRAAAYANLGDFALAQKDLDNALISDKGADVLLSRAVARMGIGDSSGAAADVQEAMNMSPKSVESKKDSVASLVASKEGHHDADLAMAQNLEQLALLELTSNAAAAESLVKRAIEIQEKTLEKGDPKLAYSLMLLGRVQLKKNDPLKAEALFRAALLTLKHNSDGTQKYAIFNLEDCARLLLQSNYLEKAGAILSDTRMTRAMLGINERPLVGDASRRAERAIDAYRLKKKNEQELASGRTSAAPTSSGSSASNASTSSPAVASSTAAVSEHGQNNNKPLRDKWALIVGISNFRDSNINLHYPAKDAKDFADFLVKEKNFAPDHVKLLTDRTATRANILSMLGNKWLPRVAAPDDLVVIYFSGHGSSSSLDVGGVNYLVAHDTDVNDLYSTAIAMQDLTRIIKDRVHSNRVMIVLDACHSGAVAPNAKGLARPANVDIDPIVQGTGQLVISSSSPEQQSWESTRYQGSVFTKHLMDGLRKNGKMTNLGDAYGYLDQAVQNEVLRDRGMLQNPVMKSRWEGRDLVIGVPPASPTKGLNDFDLPDSGKSADEPISTSKAKPHAATKPRAKGSFAKHVK